MKFAFSTIACPNWSILEALTRAKEFGFDAIEIAVDRPEAMADPEAVKEQAGLAGVAIAALATPICVTMDRRADARAGEELGRYIDLAAAVGCGIVKVRDVQPGHRCSIGVASSALAEFLIAYASNAAGKDVAVAVENAFTLRTATRLWTVLEQVDSPAVVACLDIAHAAAAGESVAVSVPTLASRIATVDIDEGSGFRIQGSEGTATSALAPNAAQKLLIRLRGIGYRGFVTFESPLPDPAATLPVILKKFKEWSTQVVAAKPSAAKAVAAAKSAAVAKPAAPKAEPAATEPAKA